MQFCAFSGTFWPVLSPRFRRRPAPFCVVCRLFHCFLPLLRLFCAKKCQSLPGERRFGGQFVTNCPPSGGILRPAGVGGALVSSPAPRRGLYDDPATPYIIMR